MQHGFRNGRSTTTQLVEIVHDFASTINKGKPTDAIFMDYSKAFDKVSHVKLLHKLRAVLKNDKMIGWVKAGRHQFVNANKTVLDIVPVKSGAPEGSILGPLFFLLYISDIVANLSIKVGL